MAIKKEYGQIVGAVRTLVRIAYKNGDQELVNDFIKTAKALVQESEKKQLVADIMAPFCLEDDDTKTEPEVVKKEEEQIKEIPPPKDIGKALAESIFGLGVGSDNKDKQKDEEDTKEVEVLLDDAVANLRMAQTLGITQENPTEHAECLNNAIQSAQAASKLGVLSDKCFLVLGDCYLWADDPEQAIAAYKKSIEISRLLISDVIGRLKKYQAVKDASKMPVDDQVGRYRQELEMEMQKINDNLAKSGL